MERVQPHTCIVLQDELVLALQSAGSKADQSNTCILHPVPAKSSPTGRLPHAVGSLSDWSHLLAQVRDAAVHIRKVEAQSHERDLRVSELLEQVQQDVQAAHARVEAAEQQAQTIKQRAAKLIKVAEERAEAAEQRAAAAEEWLDRVSEAIQSEFQSADAMQAERLSA